MENVNNCILLYEMFVMRMYYQSFKKFVSHLEDFRQIRRTDVILWQIISQVVSPISCHAGQISLEEVMTISKIVY